jgi:cation:H+ antiporter
MGYGVASIVIVGAGIWLPLIGVELARIMGWSNSFVGTLFVALATSVPELATTWGALRIGAIDMAVGNLLGSNLFDVLILALDDFAYLPGPIYAQVSPVHGVTAITACMMSGAVIVALTYRPLSRVWHIASWASISLLILYLLNAAIQFMHGK